MAFPTFIYLHAKYVHFIHQPGSLSICFCENIPKTNNIICDYNIENPHPSFFREEWGESTALNISYFVLHCCI